MSVLREELKLQKVMMMMPVIIVATLSIPWAGLRLQVMMMIAMKLMVREAMNCPMKCRYFGWS